VDAQVADSACTATAYLCGVKNNIDTIGVDANVLLNDCDAMNNLQYQVDSIVSCAQVIEFAKVIGRLINSKI
jgi:alkaline phosphatase